MKKISYIVLLAVMMFVLVSCGQKNDSTPPNSQSGNSTNNVTPEGSLTEGAEGMKITYPVTITDQAGRSVTIEKEPKSLVSCYYITSSLLIALDLDDRMVGIEDKPETRAIYNLASPELTKLSTVGSAKELDLEGCAALNADLVILPLKLKEAAGTLEELGITTILINPESEELLIEMIDLVATATNKVDRANELKIFIKEKSDYLTDILSGVDKKKVYLAGNSNMLRTAGSKMYQHGMIELAGGSNVAEEIEDTYWADIDYEQLLLWNPDYIIIAAAADYTVEDVLADEALSGCSAVANKNVYKIPSDAEAWDSPVPGGILGSVWLANILYPDLVTIEDCNSIIEEFYETFYEFKYSEM